MKKDINTYELIHNERMDTFLENAVRNEERSVSNKFKFLLDTSKKIVYNILNIIDYNKLLIISGSMITIGILIVVLSTYNSVNKYLKSSLEDLY